MKKKKPSLIISIALVVLALFLGIPLGDEPAETLLPTEQVQTQYVQTDAPVQPEQEAESPTEEPELPTEKPEPTEPLLDVHGSYTTKEDVALYIHIYGCLPDNFITKNEARALGWSGGGLEDYAPGKCIGGDRFGNYEGLLPDGHTYIECDIDTLGASSRGAKRIVFSTDGLVYYTDDHYNSFELLYGEE